MRKGITLVEAVIMVVIAGSCMVPILGTLNHGVSRANAVRLRSAMQNVAESKMNEIIDTCSYLGTPPIDETTTVPYPNAAFPEYNFVLSVEVSSPVNLIEYDGSGSGLDGAQDPSFREVSIVVSLQEAEPDIAPVCLYAMLSKPKTAGDMIYAACPGTKTIKVISPKNHALVDNYAPPAALADITQLTGITALSAVTSYIPLHLAVHPGGEWLAIKTPLFIFLMDIRANSLTRGKVWCIIDSVGTLCSSTLVESSSDPGETNTRLDRGIVFRSDGKYLFFTDRTGKIYAFEVPSALPGVNRWTQKQIFMGQNQPIGFLELCDDQNLYVGYMNAGGSNHFMAFNTHNFQEETFSQPLYAHGKTAHQRGLAATWGGHTFFEMYCGFFLGSWDKFAPTDAFYGTLSGSTYAANHDHRHNSPLVSPDNIWLAVPQATSGNQEHCGFFRIPLVTSTFADNPGSWNRSAKTNSADLLSGSAHSPWKKECILKGITSKIYFPLWSDIAAGTNGNYNTADSMPMLDLGDIPSDVKARIPEYLYVACADNSIQAIDLYGGGNGRLDESKKITLSATPVHISTTAGSDIGTVCYATATQPALLDHADDTATAMSLTVGGTNAVMAAHTLNRALIVGFKGVASSFSETTTPTNGVAVYAANSFGVTTAIASCGYALPTSFVIKAIAPMHRRDGAYILFQDTTSTPNESAIIWVEQSAHGGLGGNEGTVKWRIMYVWRGKLDGFPEGAPYKMSLSADDTMLALFDKTTTAGNTKNVIRLYDLNNQRFPMQTGLVSVRHSSTSGDFTTAALDSPRNIKSVGMTRFNGTAPFSTTWPYNFYISGSSNVHCSIRQFGTWYTPAMQRIGMISREAVRISIDGVFLAATAQNGRNLWTDATSDDGWSWNVAWTPGVKQFQGEYFDNDTNWSIVGMGWANSALGVPSSYSTSGNNISGLTAGGSPYTMVRTEDFRAFRFRPQLLKEIFLDGSTWSGDPSTAGDDLTLPDLIGGNDGWYDMCFHRDTARPTLFFIDHNGSAPSTDKIYGIGLFGSMNWLAKNPISDAYIGWNMAVSPDGRRLILTCADDDYSKVYILDISYPVPFAGPMNLGTVPCTEIALATSPVGIAVRPFNSFSSNPDSYKVTDDVVRASNRVGQNMSVVAKNGIYIVGGSDGRQGASQNTLYRYDPITPGITNLPAAPLVGRHGTVVAYDESIYFFNPYNSGAYPYVQRYRFSDTAWYTYNTGTMVANSLLNNNNSNFSVDVGAACLTPYGIVIGGGNPLPTACKVYYPDAQTNTVSPPEYGVTLEMPAIAGSANHCMVTHFSKKDKKYYLYIVGGDNNSVGNAYDTSIRRFNFDTNTWDTTFDPEDTSLTERTQLAACSWGDEIFLFGGSRGGSRISPATAIAFNPDTGQFRQIANVKDSIGADDAYTLMMSAVPCGPFIYLIDGATGINDSGTGSRRVRRYKP